MTLNDYYWGVLVEFSGTVMEIILFSFIFGSIVYFRRVKYRKMVLFNFLQLIRQNIVLLLSSIGISDFNSELSKDLHMEEIDSLSAHPIYGNTEDLIILFKRRAKKNFTLKRDFKNLNLLFSDIDRDMLLFSSLKFDGYVEKLFEMRQLLLIFRDFLRNKNIGFFNDTKTNFMQVSQYQIDILEKMFYLEKRKVDRMWSVIIYVGLFFSVLAEINRMIRSYFGRLYFRLIRKQYVDRYEPNVFRNFTNELNTLGVKDIEIIKFLKIDHKTFNSHYMGWVRSLDENLENRLIKLFKTKNTNLKNPEVAKKLMILLNKIT